MALHEQLPAVLRDAGALLRYQGELGLRGLTRAPRPAPTSAPSPAAAAVPISAVAEAAPATTTARPEPGARPDLGTLRTALQGCNRCPLSRHRTSVVFGCGNPDARLMFVGEGPGRDEDLQGEPFVGEAGRLLNRMIVAMGLTRADVYIANVVKCRPPRNRDPEPTEVQTCMPFLQQQVAAVQPEVVVALGLFAAQTLLRDTTPISRLRGAWRQYAGAAVMPTFHPAYLLRNPGDKKLVWQDLQRVMARLGPPPIPAPAPQRLNVTDLRG